MNKSPTDSANSENVPALKPRSSPWEIVLALAAIAVVGVLFGLPSLPEPFGVDHGIYGYIADRLREGAVDHRDVFDHKPPGIHVVYAAAFALFGHNMWSIRLLDLLAAIVTGWGLYALGRQWGGARMGLWCGLLYPLFYIGGFDWLSRGQPETWVNLLFVLGLALLARPRTRLSLFVAGALLGVGFWFKPTILLLAVLWPILLIRNSMNRGKAQSKALTFDVLAAGGGFAAIVVAVLSYYLFHSALRDLYEAVVVFNTRYHNRLGLVQGWNEIRQAIGFIVRPLFALTLLTLLAVAATVFPASRSSVALGFGWLALAFGTVFWQGSFARSHYVLVLPSMIFLSGVTLDAGIETANALFSKMSGRADPDSHQATFMRRGGFWAVFIGFALAAVNLATLSEARWTKFFALTGGRISTEQYCASFWFKGAPGKGGYSFQDLRDIAAYLEAHTTPDQTIFVWGFRPLIAWLAHRRMPTRFIFRYPLTRTADPRWWEQFLADLDRSPPAYFVVVLDDRGFYHPETSKDALESNGALALFLHNRYVLDRTMTDFEIYRLER